MPIVPGRRSIVASSMYSRRWRSTAAGSSSIGMQSTSRKSRTLRSSSAVAHSPACSAQYSGEITDGRAASAAASRSRPIACTRASICSRSAAERRLGRSVPGPSTPSTAGGVRVVAIAMSL